MAKKILIGEDEKPMAKALELKLNNSGFEAKAVHNGKEVVAEMTKQKYDLLLLDLIMPQLDGFGVLKELKAKKNKTPIIITSNLSQSEDEKKTRELGAVGFFVKSDTPLVKIVEEIKKILS